MAKITFNLVHNDEPKPVLESNTLVSIWWYIRNYLNDPDAWFVNQLEDGEEVDICNATYLIENYKMESELPLLISDISEL